MGALQGQGFGGEGEGGRAEKLKLGKQKAEIARRKARRRSAAASCPLISAFSFSAFQLFASCPGVRIEVGYGRPLLGSFGLPGVPPQSRLCVALRGREKQGIVLPYE